MFFHNFKYTLKIFLKNKELIFWTLLFPLILGTLFHFAFMDIESKEVFKPFEVAIVDLENKEENSYLKEAFNRISTGEEKIINIKYTNIETAKKLLKDEEIVGYLKIDNNLEVVVNKNGMNETIFKNLVLEIKENKKIIETLITNKISSQEEFEINIYQEEINKKIDKINLNIKDVTNKNLSYTMIEFYSLIAMTCLYGGLLGIFIIKQILPNISTNGKRINISCVSKEKVLISSFLATYLIQIICLLILFIYNIFILKIDFSGNFIFIILISLVGSFFGLALGTFIGLFKLSENFKTGLLISFTMFGSFFAGMMGITMKYIIDKNIPIINKINPVNMITDAFYSLYYYGVGKRYFLNLFSLLIFSFLLIILSIKNIRRSSYDSI